MDCRRVSAGGNFIALLRAVASSARIFSVILKAYYEAILKMVLRTSDQSIDHQAVVKVGARVVYHPISRGGKSTGRRK
jgi:hypothetical protein